MNPNPKIHAVIVAAGVGSRMKADRPKQYLQITDSEVMLQVTARRFAACGAIDSTMVAVSPEDGYIDDVKLPSEVLVAKCGGATRAGTVANALRLLLDTEGVSDDDWVMVHDAARPMVKPEDLELLIEKSVEFEKAGTADGCVLGIRVADTVKRVTGSIISEDIDRNGLYRISTPQMFRLGYLYNAIKENPAATDESSAVRDAGGRVAVIDCPPVNVKVTDRQDLELARNLLKLENPMQIRVGLGYDSHRLVEGRKLIIGGIEIPHTLGLLGHSDADVLLHAITDALLGAANCGNIGILFPDNDPKYKGADSRVLLRAAWDKVKAKGWQLANLDCVLVAEKPKINPHLPRMVESIASILEVDPDLVSVKPKTNEKLGFEGEQLGISARVACLLTK